MRKINKSPEPESLEKFRRNNHPNGWNDIHTDDNKHVYDDCILQCMDDQNDLCGYTEVKLNDNYHIDHFIKREIDPNKTFDWQNMIAAVHDSRYGADYKDKTVTRRLYNKSRQTYQHILNPVVDDMDNRFTFSTDGAIEPANNDDREAVETIRVFNLQEGSLNNRRKVAMENVRRLLEQMPKEGVLEYLQSEEFQSVIAYEVSKHQ